MFGDRDLVWLIEQAGILRMTCGWRIVIRAEWCDRSDGRPHEFAYALILQDKDGDRLLGFDNSHAFDGASDGDPFDHEHRLGRFGQRFPYRFRSAGQLMDDFLDRVEAACASLGMPFEFEDES